MTTSIERHQDSSENDCCISIERPEDFSMLGSASNLILIDIEESSAKSPLPDDTDGDTIPETPSYRSQSHICHGQEDDQQMYYFNNGIVSMAPDSHKDHSVTIQGVVHEGVAGGSPFSGDIAAQPSNRDGCTPVVVSHARVAKSSVRNVYSGHTTESGGPAALLGEHVSDGFKCMQNTIFPPRSNKLINGLGLTWTPKQMTISGLISP